jgi:hypothetical protein
MSYWKQNKPNILFRHFTGIEELRDDMGELGFTMEVYNLIKKAYDRICAKYGQIMVDWILRTEFTGNLLAMVLFVEVYKYSDETVESMGYADSSMNGIYHMGDGNESEDGESVPTVGCSPALTLSTFHPRADSLSTVGETGNIDTRGTREGDSTGDGGFEDRSGEEKEEETGSRGAGETDNSTGRENDDSECQIPKNPVSRNIPKWLIDIHNLAEKKNIIIHFSNSDPLNDDTCDLVPQFSASPRVVHWNPTLLYRGCSINRQYDPIKFVLQSFVANECYPKWGVQRSADPGSHRIPLHIGAIPQHMLEYGPSSSPHSGNTAWLIPLQNQSCFRS